MIQNAKAGHPGSVLSSAPILYTLFTKHLKIQPKNPNWINWKPHHFIHDFSKFL